jgi:hypothetical protein
MKQTTITIAGLTLTVVSSALHAAPFAPLRASGDTDQGTTKIYYYRPSYASYYRPNYRPYY